MEHFIQVIPVFNKEELDEFLPLLKEELKEWEEASVNNTDEPINKVHRDTDVIHLNERSTAGVLMHQYLNDCVAVYGETLRKEYGDDIMLPPIMTAGGTESYRQGMQILRYKPGQFYNYHIDKDYGGVSEESSRRTLSVVLYLTDEHEGGGTEFPHKVYKPKAGEAIVFPAEW